MEYRKLTSAEISQLTANGCTAEDWAAVLVTWEPDQSYTQYIRAAHFSGEVRLGTFNGEFLLQGGIPVHCGITNASLHNVTLGNNCVVRNVNDYIANYEFGNCCLIDNVDLIYTDGESMFGNGEVVSVLNETGGNEIVITDILTSQTAWFMATNAPSAQALKDLSDKYAEGIKASVGTTGDMVTIRNAGTLMNVCLGDYATVDGAARLANGTVNSCEKAPAKVGKNVIADDFIFSSGSHVEDGAIINKCFIGQASHVGRGFSVAESVIFSNCHFENGEGCAIFAGPFSVSHHKATLLIAGAFSFFNAGSGSNQSNHMYKTGPIQSGFLERGTSLASGSHVLWPLHAGPFSLVMGHHISHCDTSDLPFSYLLEKEGETWVVPAINLFRSGTYRNVQKWPGRDGRKDDNKLDIINFNQFSPYTVGKMIYAYDMLQDFANTMDSESDACSYNGANFSKKSVDRGMNDYGTAVTAYLGSIFSARRKSLVGGKDTGPWTDIAGLLAPVAAIDKLTKCIVDGTLESLEEVNLAISAINDKYETYENNWAAARIEEFYDIKLDSITEEQEAEILEDWKEAEVEIREAVIADVIKDLEMAELDVDGNSFLRKIQDADLI
ncbi:MAG: DUF4954 family protein [Bacteroidales bacterium]|nr:DUF4954 family protein [Bacteroidales bacterium]